MADNDNTAASHCETCQAHRAAGSLHRDTDHIRMYQALVSEERAQKIDYRDRMRSAYSTRATALTALGRINDLHDLRPNGSCTCGRKGKCPVAEILADPYVSRLIRANDAAQKRELQWTRREDEDLWIKGWDEIDPALINPPRVAPPLLDTGTESL